MSSIIDHIRKTKRYIKKEEDLISYSEDNNMTIDKYNHEKLPYIKAKKRLNALKDRLKLYIHMKRFI